MLSQTAHTPRTLSDWLGCTLCYRLYPFPGSLLLSVWRRGSPSSSSPTEKSVYFNNTPPPHFTWTLKCGSQEMKRLRQVKLSSSPHRTFLVVIHSWQNPFTLWQPMSPLMYGVVSRHDPRNVHWGPCCLPPPAIPQAPIRFCPEYRFSSGRMWRWVRGFIHIYDVFDTWQRKYADGGERQEICLRSQVWERCPCRVNMNEGGKLMPSPLLPPSLSLSLSLSLRVIYSHFIQWAHNPRGFSVRPGKCRVRAATDEYDCPLCPPRCLGERKSELFVVLFGMVRVNL